MKVPAPGKLIDIGDGRRLHAVVEGTGPVVVLEAGIAASSVSWALVAPKVSQFATVIAYDRAGFGWSDAASHVCRASDSVADLSLLLDALGVSGPVTIAGHSFGGLVARLFQQRFPERVSGLVLVDPVARCEWRDLPLQKARMLARGVSLSRRGATLARLGIVGAALNLLMSGSHRLPKLMAKASAGRAAGLTERLTGEVKKIPQELWPAIASHWSDHRCFNAMANALEHLPESVRELDESADLGELPLVVLSAASANKNEVGEHEHDCQLSTRGVHLLVGEAGHWVQLDAPSVVTDSIRRILTV